MRECLDSVLNQSFKDIEIIAVHGKSTDNSKAILEEYTQLENRMIIIDQEGRGLGNARNIGLDAAQGQYVHFLDADDFISHDFYQEMINAVNKDNTDLAYCTSLLYKDEKVNGTFSFDGDNLPFEYWALSTAWAYLFKRECVEGENPLRFDSVAYEEDNIFSFLLFRRVHSFSKADKAILYYRQFSSEGNNLMTLRKKNPEKFQSSVCHVWKRALDSARDLSEADRKKYAVAYIRFFGTEYGYLQSMAKWSNIHLFMNMKKEAACLFPENMLDNARVPFLKKYRHRLYHQWGITLYLCYLRKKILRFKFSRNNKYLILFGRTIYNSRNH